MDSGPRLQSRRVERATRTRCLISQESWMVTLIRPPGWSSMRKSVQYLLKSASKERGQKKELPCFVLCQRSGAVTVFTVVERLWRGEVGCGWMGWTGTTLQGSLQWCSMDLLRTRLISGKLQATTAAIKFVASHVPSHSDALQVQTSWEIRSHRRAYAPDRSMLMNPDSWEHDMDDLIPEATICEEEHWIDWSASPKVKPSGDLSRGAANGCSAEP